MRDKSFTTNMVYKETSYKVKEICARWSRILDMKNLTKVKLYAYLVDLAYEGKIMPPNMETIEAKSIPASVQHPLD